jgi:hypothetical protein
MNLSSLTSNAEQIRVLQYGLQRSQMLTFADEDEPYDD